jgi:hypothetical protein
LDGLLLCDPFRLGAEEDFGIDFFVEETVCLESVEGRDSLLLRD